MIPNTGTGSFTPTIYVDTANLTGSQIQRIHEALHKSSAVESYNIDERCFTIRLASPCTLEDHTNLKRHLHSITKG